MVRLSSPTADPSLTFRSSRTDLQIRLWDFHQDDLSTSCSSCIGPRVGYSWLERAASFTDTRQSNILAIAISASNRYIYSSVASLKLVFNLFTATGRGGTDNIVLKYDIARCDFASGTPVTYSPSNRYAVHQVCSRN